MYAATAEDPGPANPLTLLVNSNRGRAERRSRRAHRRRHHGPALDTAWQVTTGRPDVTIAVLDSGIKWNDDRRDEERPLQGPPQQGRAADAQPLRLARLSPATDCDSYVERTRRNGDGVFNLRDYACDSRVDLADPRRVGPPGMLTPQDLLIAFSGDGDNDGNGYVDDIAGWDFLDDDNDPFDDVQYGHGTGEIQDSTAEADNEQGGVGTCPNCTSIPLRVGDSFIADVEPLRRRRHLRDRQRRRGRPGGARRDEQLRARAPGRRLRLQARHHGDRFRRRRGRPAQQLAVEPAARDHGQLGHEVRRLASASSRRAISSSTAARTSTRS